MSEVTKSKQYPMRAVLDELQCAIRMAWPHGYDTPDYLSRALARADEALTDEEGRRPGVQHRNAEEFRARPNPNVFARTVAACNDNELEELRAAVEGETNKRGISKHSDSKYEGQIN